MVEEAPTRAAEIFLELMSKHQIRNRAELAREAGVDQSQLSKWWNGGVKISDRVLSDIIERIGDDPLDYGVDARTLRERRAAGVAVADAGDQPPAWFAQFTEQQATALKAIVDALPADAEAVLLDISERLARIEKALGVGIAET